MLKQEFEDRTGLYVTDNEYAKIEELYYSSGDIQKDEFCDLYKTVGDNKLFKVIGEKLLSYQAGWKAARKDIDDVIELLTIKAAEHDDDELEKRAISLNFCGRRNTIQIKIDNNIDLSADDLAYIRENLR